MHIVLLCVHENENEKEIGCNKEHCRSGDVDGMTICIEQVREREVKSFYIVYGRKSLL